MRIYIDDMPSLAAHDEDPDVAGPIGWVPSQQSLVAHLCEPLDDGDMVFGREFQIQVFRDCPFELRTPTMDGDADSPSWYASLARLQYVEHLKGVYVLAASTPYSTDWFDYARLKLPFKQSREQRDDKKAAALADKRGWIVAIQDSTSDLLTTDGKYLTAMLARPERVDRVISTGRRHFEPWPENDQQAMRASRPGICFGLCSDIDDAIERLKRYWRCGELISDTESGELFSKYYRHHERHINSPKPKPVHQSAKPYAERTLESSIRKALAGPIDDEFFERNPDRRISTLVCWIYLQLIYTLCQRFERGDGPQPRTYNVESIASTFGSSDHRSVESTIRDELQEVVERYIRPSDMQKADLVENCRALSLSADATERRLSCLLGGATCLECGRDREIKRILQTLCGDAVESVREIAALVLAIIFD